MKRLFTLLTLCVATICSLYAQKSYTLSSPDGTLTARVSTGNATTYSVKLNDKIILQPSAIALTLADGTIIGNSKVKRVVRSSHNEIITPQLYFKSEIEDNYNSLTVEFRDRSAIEFRAYNDGVAYRITTDRKEDYIVKSEVAEFNFAADYKCWVAYANLTGTKKDKYFTSFENTYNNIQLTEVSDSRLALSPAVVDVNGTKVCIAESDTENYPGMFLHNPDKTTSLKGHFAPVPNEIQVGGHNKLQEIVLSRHDYIASCSGKTTLPWRAIIVAKRDSELAQADMVYRLASPSRIESTEWISPGKVAWEWWNHWGLTGVDFEAGVNTATYKAYIDFAAEYGIEHVILDEGWAVKYKNNLMEVVPEIDLQQIVDYATQKGVGIILWAGYNAFNADIEGVCRHYAAMGVKGFKIDFMDRDDQPMMEFYYRTAQICAEHKLLVDFHGCAKPAGMNRTYPNVINFEAVFGLEQMKWSKTTVDHMAYDVTMPFIRMVAGPIDYTQGAMRNASKKNYRPVNREPMSQGTRCHQLAAYAVFYSPLSMLCDSPSAYRKEKECTEFIASIPTVWDQTAVLDGKIGEYVVTARRKGDTWYIGGMTNWDARTLEVDLSQILGEGNYNVDLFRDGMNAHRIASDYKREKITLPASRKLTIHLAPGGGFMMQVAK